VKLINWIIFSLELEASPEEGQKLQQKDKKKRRRKGEILKFGFLCMPK